MTELRVTPGRLALVDDGEDSGEFNLLADMLDVGVVSVGGLLANSPEIPSATELSSGAIARRIGDAALLEDLGVLFEPALQLDPLALLRDLARRGPRIARWPGVIRGRLATYGRPGRRDYFERPLRDAIVLRPRAQRFPDDPLFMMERIP